jgi:hypothetical protein
LPALRTFKIKVDFAMQSGKHGDKHAAQSVEEA